ncbi:hypothetical protein AaE_005876 [Aphanomyces astaci]|uniref:Phospholipase A2-like domain-containing protein n=1 Tax=Aphanomyces astaci TaxID=112090 RepID=A0A6A5AMU7_APHAT|nr:hypothetical protein AaE_005876 [Aphanomyces astaci]
MFKKSGNEDPSKLYMDYDYINDCPTGLPIKTPDHYRQMIKDKSGTYIKKLRGEKRKLQGPENIRHARPKTSGDWTPNGYNYMGPGNVLDNAPAQNFADEFALQHDQAYGDFQDQTGRNPKYLYLKGADDIYENQMANTRDNVYEEIAYQTFRIKRKVRKSFILQFDMSTPDEEARKRKHNYSNVVPPLLRAAGAPANSNPAEQVTPVDIPRAIFTHPFQDIITVKLQYQYTEFQKAITMASTRAATDVFTTSFRLNSPVDVITSYAYTADPSPAPDTLFGTVNSPMYWNYYSKLYRYYTVMHSKYKITVRPIGTSGLRMSAWTYHHGNQGPYIMDASFVYPTDHYKAFQPQTRCTPLTERGNGASVHNADWSERTIIGEYYPGHRSVQNEIVEDDLTRTWHKVSEVPPLKELCTLILHNADFQINTPGNVYFDYKIEVEYTVQFKDLCEQYAYPFQGIGLPAFPNYSDQTN